MRRRLAVVALAVLSACTGGGGDDGIAGSLEPGPGADGGGAGSDADTGGTGGGTSSSEDAPGRLAGATAVLTTYFDALQAQELSAAIQVSTGEAQVMASVRSIVARYHAERDRTSELTYRVRTFEVASNSPSTVAFVGVAQLDLTVSGPDGFQETEQTVFENPVVSFTGGRWKVSAYVLDSRPLEHHPAGSSTKVGDVEVRLQGALSFGERTGVVVELVTDSDHDIRVDQYSITRADGSVATPTFGGLVSQRPAALYFRVDRSDSRPVSWKARVTIDGTTSDVELDF